MQTRNSALMNEKINIKEILDKLLSKWHYVLITLAVMLPLAGLYIYFAKEVYLVRASILLSGEVKNGLNTEKFLKGMELLSSHTELEDEVGILKSYGLSQNTVKKLDFGISYHQKFNLRSVERYHSSFPFSIVLDSTISQIADVPIYIERLTDSTFNVKVEAKHASTYNFYTSKEDGTIENVSIDDICMAGKKFARPHLSFTLKINKGVPFEGPSNYHFVVHNLDALADAYRGDLDIKPISRESNMVEVSFKSNNAMKGVLFLNTLLDVYRANELSKKNQLGLKTIKFIDDQLGGVTDELRQVESSLETFRTRSNILDINTTAENLTKNLDKLEDEKSGLELKLKYYRYIAASLEKENDLKSINAPSTFGLEDPILNNLLLELTRLKQERIGLNYSTKEENPVVEVLDMKIANVKKTLVENVKNFIGASTQALADLNTKIEDVKRNVQGLPRSERELVNIKRRFDFNDNVYNYLLEKRAEAGIAIASNTVEKTIVDRARLVGYGPVTPNKKLILMLTGLFSVILSIGLIIFNDVVYDNIITTKDLERSSAIPVIGSIPHASKVERTNTIVANGRSLIGESFRSLRVNLQYLTLGNDNHVVGITSTVECEGKTFCSVNLAVAMARSGKKVIVIDGDMRKPKVAVSFHLSNEKGLSSYLVGNSQLGEIVRPTEIKGLDVITSGPIPPNPLEMIGHPRMEELITNLKKMYHAIIIDSPPMGFVSEYIILMKYTNANIYVVRSGYTSRIHLEKINRLYDEQKIKNVSILLNDLKTSLNGYHHYAYR